MGLDIEIPTFTALRGNGCYRPAVCIKKLWDLALAVGSNVGAHYTYTYNKISPTIALAIVLAPTLRSIDHNSHSWGP